MGFKLTIEQGKGRGQSFDFDAEQVTIGRTEDNDVVLYDGGVSRQHARIAFDGTHWVLSDLNSANGTTLNGAKIASEVLEGGDHVGIGQAVFRFDAAATGASTRIVSLSEAEKRAPAKAAAAPSPAWAAKAPGVDPRLIRYAGMGLVGIVAIVLVAVAFRAKNDNGLKACPSDIDIHGVSGFVFGRGVDADCQAAAKGLRFGFQGTANTRYLLHYAAFFVNGDELEILVNGQRVAYAPAAPQRQTDPQILTIPDNLVKFGKDNANSVVFRDKKGSDAQWGVERVDLESIPLAAASLEKGTRAYELGKNLYNNKNVAAPNLYNAWMELRDARAYFEGLAQKPTDYQMAIDLSARIEKELDKLCKRELFAAKQDMMYGRFEQAQEAYQFILEAFPGDAHPCRQRAQEKMNVERRLATQQ